MVGAAGAPNSPLTIPVSLTITAAPTLSPSPSQLVFAYQLQGPQPSNEVLTVNGDPSLVVTGAASSNGNWLSVTGGGNAPAAFSVAVNTAGLAPGAYQGQITVSATQAGNSPLQFL